MNNKRITMEFSLEQGVAKAMLLFAAKGDRRPCLNGVYVIKTSESAAKLVATDGHRMIVHEIEESSNAATGSKAIIPREVFEIVAKSKNPIRANLTIDCSDTDEPRKVTATTGSATATHDVVDGVFPDFERLLPKHGVFVSHPGVFNAKYLLDAANAAILLGIGNEKTTCIKMTARFSLPNLTDSERELSGADAEFGYSKLAEHLASEAGLCVGGGGKTKILIMPIRT
jgi:DNA polymerase III beta subunit, central domain